MTKFIKNFIEKYINIIEENEWEHVFLNWYNLAEEIWPDTSEFKEFIQVLVNADIQPNLESRQDVLYDEIEWIFENAFKDASFEGQQHGHIENGSISDKLHSHLGYTKKEIDEIIYKVAQSFDNLRYTDYYGGGYAW